MFLVDRQKVAVDSRHGSASSMKLRVRGDGQLVELPQGNKMTIGSGPRCNLRIERPGVEPLHCLIVHGPEGLRVRRWATDTRLNGATFDDAPLAAGDCLELGGVELDLVDPLAAALDSLSELMPLIEAEKSVGLLSYFPVEETPAEAESAAVTSDHVADEEAVEEVRAEVGAEAGSRERETEIWGPIEGGFETVAVAADVDVVADTECGTDAEDDSISVATEWDASEDAAIENVVESPAALEEVAAVVEPVTNKIAAESVEAGNETVAIGEGIVCLAEPVAADIADIECVAAVEEEADEDHAPMQSVDAVEVVFQELQAACSLARGRNRKMLAALRGLRAEKESLELRIAGANHQLPGLADKMETWEADRALARTEQRELHAELQEVRRQLGEWEARFAEHLAQMVALQRELETARSCSSAVVAPQMAAESSQAVESALPAAVEFECVAEEPSVEPCVSALFERIERPTEAVLELPTVESVESPAVDIEPANERDVVPADVRAAIKELMHDSIAEPKTAEVEIAQDAAADPWDVPAEAKVDWSVPAVTEPNDFGAAPRAWGEVPRASVGSEGELSSLSSMGSANEVVKPAWESDEAGVKEEASDDVSPFAEFSIWKQGAPAEAADDATAVEEVVEQPKSDEIVSWGAQPFESTEVAKESDAIESVNSLAAEVDANPWAKSAGESVVAEAAEPVNVPAQQASFIDRYSHLFAEEEKAGAAGTVEKAVISPMPVEKPQPLMPVRSENKPTAVSAGGDDEESIEQYMAKLLQRVRGDAAPSIASQVTGLRTSVHPSTTDNEAKPQKVEAPPTSEMATTDAPQLSAEERAAEVEVNWDAFTKRAATAPATNLGALRALANETARRDIGRHELRTFRRNAVTKVIVSALAGMTSLWLMLNSPNWRDIQFITACVALIVAAYWAGEAFRTMLYSMRVAAHDGPRTREVVKAALPIDVEAEKK